MINFTIFFRKTAPPRKRELQIEDVTRHLAFAFNGFLTRQAAAIEDAEDERKGKMNLVIEILKEIFELPDDDSLKISRDLELIFLQNNRREIPVPKEPEVKEEPAEEKEETKEETTEAGNDLPLALGGQDPCRFHLNSNFPPKMGIFEHFHRFLFSL